MTNPRWAMGVLLALGCGFAPARNMDPTRPNVVVILADDMGIDSVSAFNDKLGLTTPALDRLAGESVAFMDAHSTSGVCSPTRYSVLTGRYHWRSRLKRGIVGKWERPLIEDERLTLPEMLKQHGYDTACIGKWHLGWHWPKKGGGRTEKLADIDFTVPVTGGPTDHGFDAYFGDDVPNWPPYAWREDDRILGDLTTQMKAGTMVGVSAGPAVENWDFAAVLPEYARRCARYVRERAATDTPFFLFFPMPSPHTPIAPDSTWQGRSEVSAYADFLLETDWAVGEVLAALEESGQAGNTLVIFTADNGTSPKCNFAELESNGVRLREHWRGHKADVYEGGHRVAFMVRWPGHGTPGARSDQLISLTDIMATVADAVGVDLPVTAGEDSVSLRPVLGGDDANQPLHEIVIHHSSQGFYAVRQGRWKLLLCRGSGGWSAPSEADARKQGLPAVQLYDLQADPREQRNLQAAYPEKVSEMTRALRRVIEAGRSTPGPRQPNHGGMSWWPGLPWPKP